jgi:hypothetical protein
MFLLCSINTSIYQGADRRRFAQLCLQSQSSTSFDERRTHWDALDRDLDRFISPEIGRRLIARTVALLGGTLGNFAPEPRRALLAAMAKLAGPEGRLLLGFGLE